jgi:AcrR family transcriptional regulator
MYRVVQVYSGGDWVMSKSDSKRQAILEIAYRLFRAQGFDGTSMADITSQVGGSKATLYSHFPSKEELFVECMMAALENYMEVRRLMIAEAARSGTGKLFFDKIAALRSQISSFLAACMASGLIRRDDPDLAADHLGALLEAEILEPLLLHVREGAPDEEETTLAARRAVAAFLRAYAPTVPPMKIAARLNAHVRRLPPHEL